MEEIIFGFPMIFGFVFAAKLVEKYFDKAREEATEKAGTEDYELYYIEMKKSRQKLAVVSVSALALTVVLAAIDKGKVFSIAILGFVSGASAVAIYASIKCRDRFN